MRKLFNSVLVVLLVLALFGCNSDEKKSPEERGYYIKGETAKADVEITLTDVIFPDTKDFIFKPDEGNIYLILEFELVNNSKEEVKVSSILEFEGHCDGKECYQSFTATEKYEVGQLDGSIAVGDKLKGGIGFEIPKDWKEFELDYKYDLFNSDNVIKFKVKK